MALIETAVTITATPLDSGSTITVNGTPVASGVPSAPIALVPGANVITIDVTTSSGTTETYIIAVSRGTPQGQTAYLKASNTDAGDHFGQSISMSGNTIVVGASVEHSSATGVNGDETDNSAPYSGAAYVFVRSGGLWVQEAYLKASNTDQDDGFGVSVSISGDTIVVGAPLEDSNATGVDGNQADNSVIDSGASYVFVRSGGVWTQEAYLKASNTRLIDYFGTSVSISGDTIVVGAFAEDLDLGGVINGALYSGAAYVFRRTGGIWAQEAYLKASNAEPYDQFGYSVSVSGDTLVVGAITEKSGATGVNGNELDNSRSNSGAAYVYVRSGTTWNQEAYLKASNTDIDDWFGHSVAISADTIVVGAYLEDSNASVVNGDETDNSALNAGAAYVFTRVGSTWSQQAYLKASNAEARDVFGWNVACCGDMIVIGASAERSSATGLDGDQLDNNTISSGAAYVFLRTGTTWTQGAYIKASNTGVADFFGHSVACFSPTVVVGANNEASSTTGVNGNQADDSADDAGAVYVFE